jgi:tRNA wybutosine-synthesizing protein 4
MSVQTRTSQPRPKGVPKLKPKQDEAIISTNDYSIVSKRSVEKLYYRDEPEFLRAFVNKYKRRAPLINRGYWLRMRAIEAVVTHFLDENARKSKAIVNLGCGYEPLAFRMLWKYPKKCHNVKFIDIDFPQLIQKKFEVIKREAILNERLDGGSSGDNLHPSVILSSQRYCAVGCDLGDNNQLQSILKNQLELDDCAILFIGEVSIVYMPPQEATDLIRFCSTFHDGKTSYVISSKMLTLLKLEYASSSSIYHQARIILLSRR